jgi:type VI secretion system protein ImpF
VAELGLKERLQPALLDRLTDDEPDKKLEAREQRVLSVARLRSFVLRDLSWLLNSVHLAATEDLSELPEVERSVINYGIPGFAGGSTDQHGVKATEEAIREAIVRYEPRLIPKSVKVALVTDSLGDDSHNRIALEIDAELWCQPLPLQMYMKTELDLELGDARVIEQSEADRVDARGRRRR